MAAREQPGPAAAAVEILLTEAAVGGRDITGVGAFA
jgi:hypothetical protein